MRIEAACFTQCGQTLGEKLAKKLAILQMSLGLSRCGTGGLTVRGWTAAHFRTADALLFIGAAGIAVRAVAQHVASKTSDPAVLVVDERGKHVIPLLSGHIGGANALARQLADVLGAEAVITTSTDVNDVFAVDTWASENGYTIQNPVKIKKVSAKLLAGEVVTLYSDFPIKGDSPEGMACLSAGTNADVVITIRDGKKYPDALRLTPPAFVLGIGCRRGATEEEIEMAFRSLCAKKDLCPAAFGLVCSINLKSDEPGLLAFCKNHSWPLRTFSANDLAGVPGTYTGSSFVEGITGVDNVCERSAMLGCGGKLLVEKTVSAGITLAVAQRDWTVLFGEEV